MTLPEGWELDEDGFPRPVKKKRAIYNLSDLMVDEVSFVERGANPRANIVLVKSEDGQLPKESTMFDDDPDREMLATIIESAAVTSHNPNPKRVQQLPTMRVPEKVSNSHVAGRPEQRELTKAQQIAKGLDDAPQIYDRLYAPKAELSGAALALRDIAKTDDPVAIAKLLSTDPRLYDILLETDQRR